MTRYVCVCVSVSVSLACCRVLLCFLKHHLTHFSHISHTLTHTRTQNTARELAVYAQKKSTESSSVLSLSASGLVDVHVAASSANVVLRVSAYDTATYTTVEVCYEAVVVCVCVCLSCYIYSLPFLFTSPTYTHTHSCHPSHT